MKTRRDWLALIIAATLLVSIAIVNAFAFKGIVDGMPRIEAKLYGRKPV